MTIYDSTLDGAVFNWRDQDDESAVTIDVAGNRIVLHGSDALVWLELAVRCMDCAKVQRIRERERDLEVAIDAHTVGVTQGLDHANRFGHRDAQLGGRYWPTDAGRDALAGTNRETPADAE